MATNPIHDASRLQRAIRALVRRFQLAERADVSCCGLTVAQAATLDSLADGGELRPGDLSRRLGITASTLTRNLARLEERGLVSRTGDPEDARAARIFLSEAGVGAAAEIRRQEDQFALSILEHLPAGSQTATLEALERLLVAVRTATESCCPGAFDHLMSGPEWTPCCTPEEP